MVFILRRLKFNEETSQWSEIRKTKIALRGQPGGIECHLCFIIYGEAIHLLFQRLVLSPCRRELCTARSRVAMLHCLLNQQFSIAEHRSQAGADMQGLFDDIITADTLIVGRALRVKRCHGRLHTHVCPCLPPQTQKCPPVRKPHSVALQRQIILDDFILITFTLIFFYRRSAMPRWLQNIPQVGAHIPSWSTRFYTRRRLRVRLLLGEGKLQTSVFGSEE